VFVMIRTTGLSRVCYDQDYRTTGLSRVCYDQDYRTTGLQDYRTLSSGNQTHTSKLGLFVITILLDSSSEGQ
jgi:hypothetical protein